MAHEVETMAYANQVPWHGLGAQVSDDLMGDEFMKAAGLDWTVEQHPVFAHVGGEQVEIENKRALVRSSDNAVLTVTSPGWVPLQNRQVFDFMTEYVAAGGAKLETAGSLRGGRIIWGLANLGHSFEVGKGDKVAGYLLFTSPHEVGKAITIRTTTVRVVCANTLAMANRDDVQYSQNHLSEFDPEAARAHIEKANDQLAVTAKSFRQLQKLKLSTTEAMRKAILPVFQPNVDHSSFKVTDEKKGKTVIRLLESLVNAPGAAEGTGWNALNGVTHYCDHVGGMSQDGRMASSFTGDFAKKKIGVMDKLLELVA